jgi:hypothetical protein
VFHSVLTPSLLKHLSLSSEFFQAAHTVQGCILQRLQMIAEIWFVDPAKT